MTIQAAISQLESMRCEGVAESDHYGFGVWMPDALTRPTLFWGFSEGQAGFGFGAEVYDAMAASLRMGATLTLAVQPFKGRGTPEVDPPFAVWLQRIMNMLANDLFVGDTLTMPMDGQIRKVGVLDGVRVRYAGIQVKLNLSVRIDAPLSAARVPRRRRA